MKRFFAILLAIMLAASITPVLASAEPVTITIMRSEHASFTYNMDQPVIKALEEKLGIDIKLQVYSSSDYKGKLRMLLGTDDLPDITFSDYTLLADYVADDMFVNLTEHWDELPNYAATIARYENLANAFKVDGSLYWFIMTAEDAEAYTNSPVLRQDILAKIGWDHMPDSFSELYEVLKAIKAYDPDSIPFVTRGVDVLWRMGFGFGTYNGIYYEPDAAAYQYGPLYSHYKDFLTYMNKLYTEGLLDPDFASSNKSIWMEKLTSGKSYFLYDNGSFVTDINNVTTASIGADARFMPMTTLANDYGGRRNEFFEGVGYISPFRNDVWAVSSSSEHIEECLKLMDYVYGEEGAMLCSYGIENVDYTVDADGKVQLTMDKVNEYKQNATDPYREYKNELGTGALAFSGRFYETRKWFLDDASNEMYAFWLADKNIAPHTYTLCLSADDAVSIADKKTACDTLVATESLKFIMGTRSLDEYDAFVKELTEKGAQDIEQIYNAAYEASKQ